MLDSQALLREIIEMLGTGGLPNDVLDRVVAMLHERVRHYTWVGIYLLDGAELVLGPYRGKPSPHTRIPLNKGICGAAASQQATIIVPDVNADPRFLACSLETKSEIVVPIMSGSECLGEIDIDSDQPDAFDDTDRRLLEAAATLLVPVLRRIDRRATDR
ncbi:MAG: GAF domain-containing protein [Candidatus Zixiibacteriota bacterium]